MFKSQSLESRKNWTEGSARNKAKTKDIGDWSEEQYCEFGRYLDNICLVTGFSIDDVHESIQ